MKLTVLHTESSDGWGGQERRIVAEAVGIRDAGHRVMLVARPGAQIVDKARDEGLETFEIPMANTVDPRCLVKLPSLLRRERVDIVNSHSSVDTWHCGWATRLRPTPWVRTRHISKRIRPHGFNRVHRWPDLTITTGGSLRRDFIEDTGVAPQSVISVPTGIDTGHFRRNAGDGGRLRGKLRIAASASIVGAVAVLRQDKRLDLVVDALAELRRRGRDVHLVVAGEGSRRPHLEAHIEDAGLGRVVHLLGHVEDVRPVLAGADVIASASPVEGVPQSLAQALAMERPVVAADAGSVDELVLHGQTGLLVRQDDSLELADGLARLLDDREFATALAQRGRNHVVEGFSRERMVQRMLEAYQTALRRS